MKTLWTPSHVTVAGAFALCFAFATPVIAQRSDTASDPSKNKNDTAASTGASTSAAPAMKLQVATEDARDHLDSKLTGRNVKGSDGKDLGNIKDFMVNPTAGSVEYAVISTGGVAGIGDKLRLVPVRMLRLAGAKDFSTGITKANWDEIAPLPADAYKADVMTMTAAEHGQVAAHFSANRPGTASSPASQASSLVKASDLHGKEVRSAGQDVGKLDGVVIDIFHGTAEALFDPKRDFAGTTEKFIVPLNQFAFAGGHEPASALFSREDFDEASGLGLMSSSSSGTLPVASNTRATETRETQPATTTDGTNTDRSAQTAASDHGKGRSQDVAAASKQSSSSVTSATSAQTEVATNRTSADEKSSTAPSAGGGTTSDIALSRTDRADTNGVNPAAVASNSAQKPTSANNEIKSSQVATGVAATSTPSRTSTAENANASTSPAASDQNLTPTGQTSADQAPSSDPALNSAAMAVRNAFDDNPSLARLNVAVTPEGGKVVLRGSVASSQLKTALEDTARRAAKDRMIDSQVTIEGP